MKREEQRQVRFHVPVPHLHTSLNANAVHLVEQELAGTNTRIAVFLTRTVGTMWTAYTFVLLAFIGLCAILNVLPPLLAVLIAWLSQTLIQLVLLPVIMVGQNVLSRKSEIQSDEAFKATINTYHDIEQIMLHLDKQDQAILEIVRKLEEMMRNGSVKP